MRLDAREGEAIGRRLATLPEYQPGPGPIDAAAADDGKVDLSATCAGKPIRHKVSSGFVRRQVNPKLVPALTRVIRKSIGVLGARQYVSLHCLGGAIFNDRLPSAYAFRDRIVLLQYQAWWQPHAPELDAGCIRWVENVRKTMTPYVDGAFINFVDRDIPLREYYKDKLPQLMAVKKQWDPDDFFSFEMSIPPA
jgi:hypothetical protein